jgi:hypothetical protein
LESWVPKRFCEFFSTNSMWLYLWHILVFYLLGFVRLSVLNDYFILRYVLCILLTISIFRVWEIVRQRFVQFLSSHTFTK